METTLLITKDEFYEKYKPQKNHLDDTASWDGILYEIFDDELLYCFELAQKENRVWTILECKNEDWEPDEEEDDEELDPEEEEEVEAICMRIMSGFHYGDRLGFIVTKKSYYQDIEVKIDL